MDFIKEFDQTLDDAITAYETAKVNCKNGTLQNLELYKQHKVKIDQWGLLIIVLKKLGNEHYRTIENKQVFIKQFTGILSRFNTPDIQKSDSIDEYYKNIESDLVNLVEIGVVTNVIGPDILITLACGKIYDDLNQVLQTRIVRIDAQLKESEKLIEKSNNYFTKQVVSKFGKHYNDSAKNKYIFAHIWLVLTFISFLFTIMFSLDFLFPPGPFDFIDFDVSSSNINASNNPGTTSFEWIGRATFIGLLVTATTWCAKRYQNSMHLYETYKYKQISVDSLEAFLEASTRYGLDQNTVLSEIAKLTFSPIDTGYTSNKSQNNTSIGFFDTLKTATETGNK